MEPEQLVLCDSTYTQHIKKIDITTAYEQITKSVNANNFIWLNQLVFHVTSGNNLHSFIARVISEVYDP